MDFDVTILGSNSAIPAFGRFPTSQIVNYNSDLFMIDCGEGAQMQLSRFKIKRSKIGHIFISHLHGDHYFGLIGLITSYHLLKRTEPLHVYAPKALKEIIEVQLKASDTKLGYELKFRSITHQKDLIFENDCLTVETIPLNHRIDTTGFLFKEKCRPKNLIKEKLEHYKIPIDQLKDIKKGADYTDAKGHKIANSELTCDPPAPRTYAYCSDTAYLEKIIPQIKEADLLYHEATFDEESAERAKETFHSTAKQAATIAKKAAVQKLVIGHFSAKYRETITLLEEAKSIFENTAVAIEGEKFVIGQ